MSSPSHWKISPLTILALIGTLLFFGSGHVAIRVVMQDKVFSPYELALVRYTLASLILGGLVFFKGKSLPRKEDWLRLAAGGFLGVTVFNVALNLGQSLIKAGPGSFIVNTIPMFTAIFSVIFLREMIRLAGWLGIAVSLMGVGIVAVSESDGSIINLGACAILVAALAWSGAIILQKPLLDRYGSLELMCFSMIVGTALLLPWAGGAIDAVRNSSPRALLVVGYLGVFPAALAYLCWGYVLARMPANKAASFLYLVPVVSTVTAFVWIGELPGMVTLVGCGFILGGVVLVNLIRLSKQPSSGRA